MCLCETTRFTHNHIITQPPLPPKTTTFKVEIERELPKFRPASRPPLDGVARAALALRADMSALVTALQYYVTYEVLEGER